MRAEETDGELSPEQPSARRASRAPYRSSAEALSLHRGRHDLISGQLAVTTTDEIEIVSPQPRQVAWLVQVHYQEIHFTTERTQQVNLHALWIAVADRSNRQDFAGVHLSNSAIDHSDPPRVQRSSAGYCDAKVG
jgi:hypothetical protein